MYVEDTVVGLKKVVYGSGSAHVAVQYCLYRKQQSDNIDQVVSQVCCVDETLEWS